MLRDELFFFCGIVFEWNADKVASNIPKHRIRFAEGATVFADQEALMIGDPERSSDESRFILVGFLRMGTILVVVYVERGMRFRIISARKAIGKERPSMKKADNPDLDQMRPEYIFPKV